MLDLTFPNKDLKYTKNEQKIVNYLYQNMSTAVLLSIGQLSEQLGISEATISRFVRHVGFSDYKELKAYLATYLATYLTQDSPAQKLAHTLQHSDKKTMLGLLQYQQYCLEKTIVHLDDQQIDKAVSTIVNSDTIYIFGKGASSSLAKLLHFRLNRFGKRVIILPTGGSELFETLAHIKKEDLVILFGFQKTPKEAEILLKHKEIIGYTTLLISSRLYFEESNKADIHLFAYRGEVTEYHSMTSAMALIDALILLTADQIGDAHYELLSELYQLKERYKTEIPR